MRKSLIAGLFLLLGNTACFAETCPIIEMWILDKGFAEVGPWQVMSGSAAECSFRTRDSSVNFGFNHNVTKSAAEAMAAATEMKQVVAGTSVVEPMLSLGENGFTYQPKTPNGTVDRTSMSFSPFDAQVDLRMIAHKRRQARSQGPLGKAACNRNHQGVPFRVDAKPVHAFAHQRKSARREIV